MDLQATPQQHSGSHGPPPGSMASDPAAAGKKPSGLSVLVVDDEPLIRWSLRKGLARSGHDVAEAGTGAEALQLIEAEPNRFNVVILDYRLPDRRDLSLLKDVRDRLPTATVLMMTAYGDADMRAQALALGALTVIDKPFQVSALVSLVESSTSPRS